MTAFASEEVPVAGISDAAVHEGMLYTAKYLMKMLVGDKAIKQGLLSSSPDEEKLKTPLLDDAKQKLESLVGKSRSKVNPKLHFKSVAKVADKFPSSRLSCDTVLFCNIHVSFIKSSIM